MIFLALIATALIAFRFWWRITALDASISDLKSRVQELEQRLARRTPQPKTADEVRTPPVAVTPAIQAPPARPPQPVVVQPPTGPAVEPPAPHVREPQPVAALAAVAHDSGVAQQDPGATEEGFETRFAARWLSGLACRTGAG